jgi:glycogen operon protein
MARDEKGTPMMNPPILWDIESDPVLAGTKIIAEAWDAAGLYQVGDFIGYRWAEWNGRFRDDIRRFVRGDPGTVGSLATRLSGSSDLFQSDREPGHGINFVTSHDGFTLSDLVSYNGKHNDANGEENRDGDEHNLSWNCGREGPVSDPETQLLRERQVRNFATLLVLSRGVPMILGGDEMGRTQGGNNNAYCQDNRTSWLDWRQHESNPSLFRFFKLLIAFRRAHELLRYDSFTRGDKHGPEIDWHGFRLGEPDWGEDSRSLAMHLSGGTPKGRADDIYLIANAHWESHDFSLPGIPQRRWCRFVDTARRGDGSIIDPDMLVPIGQPYRYRVESRSVVVLVSKISGG